MYAERGSKFYLYKEIRPVERLHCYQTCTINQSNVHFHNTEWTYPLTYLTNKSSCARNSSPLTLSNFFFWPWAHQALQSYAWVYIQKLRLVSWNNGLEFVHNTVEKPDIGCAAVLTVSLIPYKLLYWLFGTASIINMSRGTTCHLLSERRNPEHALWCHL